MKSSIFEDATEATAKTIGRRDVQVVFAGNEAKTDGRTVYLPKLPSNSEINEKQQGFMRGLRDHESLHLRCTDTTPSALARLTNLAPFVEAMVQFCEDTRVERAGIAEYSGMRENLLHLQRQCGELTLNNIKSSVGIEQLKFADRKTQMQMVFQAIVRNGYGLPTDEYDEIVKHADKDVVKFAEKWAKDALTLPLGLTAKGRINEAESKKGTAESFALGERIAAAWDQEIEPKPRQQPQPQPQPQPKQPPQPKPDDQEKGQGEGDSGEGEGDDTGEGGSDEEADKEEEKGTGDGDSDDDNESEDGSGSDTEAGEDEPEPEQDGGDDDGEDDADADSDDGGGDGADDEQDGGSDSGGSDSGDSGEDAGDSSGDGDGDGDPTGDGQSGDQTSGGGAGEATGNSGVQFDANALDAALANAMVGGKEAMQAVLEEIVGTTPDSTTLANAGTSSWRPYSNEFEQVTDILKYARFNDMAADRIIAMGQHTYDKLAAKIKDKQAMIRRILEIELQARADRQWQSGKKSGRIDQMRLVSALQGAENVYRKREDGREMDTLLHISCDASSSMSGTRAEAATLLSLALAEALERTGCDIAVEAWGDYAKTHEQKNRELGIYNEPHFHEHFSSLGSVERLLIKAPHHRMTAAESRARMGLMQSTPHGGTPGWEALFSTIRAVGKCKQKKKVLLFITDGEFDRGRVAAWARDANALARALDIHMIGVGINGMNVSHIFSDCVAATEKEMYDLVIRRIAKFVAQDQTSVHRHAA